ncbi:MAG TPA: threonine dehydratase [Planctomycetota bacterium]|nr:threonine dehydratase [Planctomycetota bacterium]
MTPPLTLTELDTASAIIRKVLPPTPQYHWPLLSQRAGAEIWVKHENHLPTGAFKVRGGVLFMSRLKEQGVKAVVAATRGNHGQSLAYAARLLGMRATIVVPQGNSSEKNSAMRAWGAELIEHGADFQAALEHANALANERRLQFVPSFALELVCGVASYALEFFRGAPELNAVYVPIGLGSGICGMIAARDALKLDTEIVGVVADGAPCYAESFREGRVISTAAAQTMADGIACRVPDPTAFEIIQNGAARIVRVTDAQIQAAMRHYFSDTHQIAEGAGAAGLAGALAERPQIAGKRIGVVLSGGNVDRGLYASILEADSVSG